MDLTTTYLGLKLRTPLVPSASPLSEELDKIKQMEDAGAAAVVFYSLFEEQLRPRPEEIRVGPDQYLRHIERAKKLVKIPVIASLNGTSPGSWTEYARLIEKAGADALELNIYHIPTDMKLSSADLEEKYLDIVRSVRSQVKLPLAVKVSPFFTNFAYMAGRLDDAGADGLVLFNRFYQPDIDLAGPSVRPNILLSTPMAMRLPLRWIAILYSHVRASLAATSGIHRATDVVKLIMAGADVTMLCSVLMRHGIEQIGTIEHSLVAWMEDHGYKSLADFKGTMSQKNSDDPAAFERAQYMRGLCSYSLPPIEVVEP